MRLPFIVLLLYCTNAIIHSCIGIKLIDVSQIDNKLEVKSTTVFFAGSEETDETSRAYPPLRTTTKDHKRRFMIVTSRPVFRQRDQQEKDGNLKSKIGMLVQQSIHDAKNKMKTIESLKEKFKHDPGYKVGFILSMLKKSKDVMTELFNVAVKHRNDWKALEQMKIFELIVHTNVDTTNLVRQLVEIHIQNMNSTDTATHKRRVVLL